MRAQRKLLSAPILFIDKSRVVDVTVVVVVVAELHKVLFA